MTSSRRSPSNAAGAASSWKLSRSLFAPLTALDWLLILLLGSFLLANCVVHSQHRLLWSDELLAARITGDTFPSMVRGWWWGADGGPPLFYLGGWLLQHLFGHAELSLRLFSAAGMGIAATLLWAAARRYAGTLPVAVAVATCFLLPSYVRWQEVNGRFYGLFFATAALASLMFLITAECGANDGHSPLPCPLPRGAAREPYTRDRLQLLPDRRHGRPGPLVRKVEAKAIPGRSGRMAGAASLLSRTAAKLMGCSREVLDREAQPP